MFKLAYFIEIAYEVMGDNDSSDFDEALRIYGERKNIHFTLAEIERAAAAYQNEFKEIVDIEFYRKNWK